MRTLLIGLLAAPLVGCSIPLSPLASTDSCTDANGFLASASKSVEPASTSSKSSSAVTRTKSAVAAKAEERPATAVRDKPQPAEKKPASPVIEAKVQVPASSRPAETTPDPVIVKAKATISAKLEDSASAEFGEMKRAMRKNTLGKSVDTICGRVKGRKASGEGGDWPYLYLVTENEAYVVNGPANSAAASAYRNICSEPGTTELSPATTAKDRKVL
jgi:hypothetical protein